LLLSAWLPASDWVVQFLAGFVTEAKGGVEPLQHYRHLGHW